MAKKEEIEGTFFPYRKDTQWFALLAALRVTDADGAWVTDDQQFVATFGRWYVRTPISNISGTTETGPHRWYTSVGLRGSFTDSGLTFGTNHKAHLCVEFVEPVKRMLGPRRHRALSISVADPKALAAAIAEAGA